MQIWQSSCLISHFLKLLSTYTWPYPPSLQNLTSHAWQQQAQHLATYAQHIQSHPTQSQQQLQNPSQHHAHASLSSNSALNLHLFSLHSVLLDIRLEEELARVNEFLITLGRNVVSAPDAGAGLQGMGLNMGSGIGLVVPSQAQVHGHGHRQYLNLNVPVGRNIVHFTL